MNDIVLAHAFGQRYELPLPLGLFVAAGTAVVALSFLLVLRQRPASPLGTATADELPSRAVPVWLAGLTVALALVVAGMGLLGTQVVSDNLAPLWFWLLVWIVVPMSCGAIGDWTKPVNPFANAARLLDDPATRQAILARRDPLGWPRWLGWWPAVVLFVLLVLGELVFNFTATLPSFVGGLIVVYLLTCAVGGLLFGPAWLQHAEVFTGLYDTWGRLGRRRFGQAGRDRFGGGLDAPFASKASRTVFVLLLLVSINFDGLLATPEWARWESRNLTGERTGLEAFRTASLAVTLLVLLGLFTGFAVASARAGGRRERPVSALSRLLPSLVPIAYGYLIAHYLQYILTNGQLFIPLAGAKDYQVDTALLPNSFYWYLSVVVIVAVHVVAIFVAHRSLVHAAEDETRARRSEYPWLVAMVLYTALSLLLIARPLTEST